MTAAKLFYQRLRAEIRFQYGVFRLVGDWTVIVYLGIPALLAVVIWNVNMWLLPLSWMDSVPFPLFAFILYLLLSRGSVRLFLQEADFLFLRQHQSWMDAIIRRGMAFSFLRDVVIVAVWFALAAPFLVQHYEFSWLAVMALYALTLFVKENDLYASNLLSLRFSGFLLKMFRVFVWFLFAAAYIVIATPFAIQLFLMTAAAVVAAGCLLFFVVKRLHAEGSFLNDVEREQEAKWKYASFAFMQSMPKEKKSLFSRRRPYLFPKSGRIFRKDTPAHRLADTYMKLFFRKRGMLRIYFVILGLADAFIVLTPFAWLKWGGWMAILCLLAALLRGFVKENEGHSFLHLWRWDPETKQKAAETTIYFLLLPNAVITGCVLGWLTFSWLGALVVISIGVGIARPVASVFTPMYFNKE